ncbi:MAG: hypothetical protein FWF24_07285 [Alphaproteobacteria bacterium]|nr:hypothetical protein [Alphaproteobacteria bacterium]
MTMQNNISKLFRACAVSACLLAGGAAASYAAGPAVQTLPNGERVVVSSSTQLRSQHYEKQRLRNAGSRQVIAEGWWGSFWSCEGNGCPSGYYTGLNPKRKYVRIKVLGGAGHKFP